MTIDFDKFFKVTKYNIKDFLQRYSDFYTNEYQSIVNYYQGGDAVPSAFTELDYLLTQSYTIDPLFSKFSKQLDTLDMWELLDIFTECQSKLLTTDNLGKWTKSSRLNTNDVSVKVDKIQRQSETIEDIAKSLGYTDSQDTWAEIALDNSVIEEDYTMEGGTIFTVKFRNNAAFDLPNIVDYFTGKNVLGKDINKKIKYVNNDLDTVKYEGALNQSFEIKIDVRKNSIPESPQYGFDASSIGTSVSALNYPTIFRNILVLFRKDKRWKDVKLLDIYREDSAVFIKFEAKSISGDEFTTNIAI